MTKVLTKVFKFRTGRPEKSGEYIYADISENGSLYSIGNIYYNKDVDRWNDRFGTGEHSFEVDLWAEIPKEWRKKNG